MTDRYAKIRKALAMGPTKGPWGATCGDAYLITACDPDTIRALLEERDALREALKELIAWFPSAGTYQRLGFDPDAPMRAYEKARAALKQEEKSEQGQKKNHRAFLRDLEALAIKHGVVIGGCGCCGSPWLRTAPKNPEAGFYRYRDEDSLRFIHPSNEFDWKDYGSEKP